MRYRRITECMLQRGLLLLLLLVMMMAEEAVGCFVPLCIQAMWWLVPKSPNP